MLHDVVECMCTVEVELAKEFVTWSVEDAEFCDSPLQLHVKGARCAQHNWEDLPVEGEQHGLCSWECGMMQGG